MSLLSPHVGCAMSVSQPGLLGWILCIYEIVTTHKIHFIVILCNEWLFTAVAQEEQLFPLPTIFPIAKSWRISDKSDTLNK